MKILIAEDDRVSRILLSEVLANLGHEVIAVEDGQKAWEAYSSQPVPLLISDWMMPSMNGLELSRKIRAEKRASYTYIILLTARSGKANYLEGMEAGADDFMVKPFDPDELQARLKAAGRVLALQQEVRQLRGLLPICSYCKKIRDDRDVWTQMEVYVSERSEALFSHGLCPDCYDKELKPQLDELDARMSETPPREK
jgi:phosphoserine phosphatase RsbU/P